MVVKKCRIPHKFTLIFILSNLFSLINSELYNLTDTNFDNIVRNGETKPWIIMFHVKNCARCVKSHEILLSYANSSNFSENFGFGRVECNDNSFTCLRFDQLNISRMPNLIVVEKHRLFRYKGIFTNETYIEQVINDERTVEKGWPLPASIGYMGLFSRIFGEMLNLGDVLLEEFVQEYLGMKIEWKRAYTLVLFFGFLFIVLVVEYFLYKKFCGRRRDNCGANCNKRHVHNFNSHSHAANADMSKHLHKRKTN